MRLPEISPMIMRHPSHTRRPTNQPLKMKQFPRRKILIGLGQQNKNRFDTSMPMVKGNIIGSPVLTISSKCLPEHSTAETRSFFPKDMKMIRRYRSTAADSLSPTATPSIFPGFSHQLRQAMTR